MTILSAADILQAKTDTAPSGTSATVDLDDPCAEGSTVIVELYCSGLPIMATGMGGSIPAGFTYDACSELVSGRYQHVFSKSAVTAGEQSWVFSLALAAVWHWRVTEWGVALDPVYALEASTYGTATGTGPTSLSTGATTATSRSGVVCLVWHMWERTGNTAQAFDWSAHTNGFTERDELRWTAGAKDGDSCWSCLFSDNPDTFECTATINLTTRAAGDLYFALLVVYGPTVPDVVAGPTMMAG